MKAIIRCLPIALMAALLPACGSYYDRVVAPKPDIEDAPGYYQLAYDYEVAQICGLVDRPVQRNYKTNRKQLEQKSGMGLGELKRIRIAAMVAADREYNNRSLGGHRQWCRTSGKSGVKRILSGIHLKAG